MTVPSQINKSGPYNGNGVTTAFDYEFRIVDDSHVAVILTDSDGNESTLTLTTDYTVTGVGATGGGQVITIVPPATGTLLTMIRNVPFVQETDLENQGAYNAEDVEDALDLAAMRDQQLQEQIDRAVQIPVSADPSELEALIGNVIRLAGSADQIDTVAENVDAVNEVADALPALVENLTDIHNFADVYQGAKAADPATRNDGSPLQPGDLYFNTSAKLMQVFDGTEWRDASAQSLNMSPKSFVGTGAQTAFTLDAMPGVAANVLVWVGGVRQKPTTDYTVSGTTLTLLAAPGNGVEVDTLVVSTVSVLNVPAEGSVVEESIADGAVTRNKLNDGAVSEEKLDPAVVGKIENTQVGTVAKPNIWRFETLGVMPEDFGYDEAANLDGCRVALNAWGAAHGRKRMRSGVEYFTNGPIVFSPSTKLLDMEGAKVNASLSETAFTAGQALFQFGANAPTVASQLPALTTTHARGSYALTFAGTTPGIMPSALVPGDVLCIFNLSVGSFSTWRDYYHNGEFAIVDQVIGNTVYLTSPTRAAYGDSNIQIRRVAKASPRIIGGETVLGLGTKRVVGMRLDWCTDARVEGFRSGNARSEGMVLQYCFGVSLTDVMLDQFIRGNLDGIADHYGLGLYNSQSVKVRGGRYVGGNHGFALGGGAGFGSVPCRDIDVSGADIKAWYLAGTSIHGNAEDVSFRGCTIDGGATFGGDRIRYSDCLIRMGPDTSINPSAATVGAQMMYAIYTAEALGVDYSVLNTRIEALKTPPEYGSFAAIDFGGTQNYITAKTTRGGTIRMHGVTVEAPNHTRIVQIGNQGSTNDQRRIDIDDLHVLNALQGGGRIYDVGVFNSSGTSWASTRITNVQAKGGAIII